MRDRHHPRLCGSCGVPMACVEDACWRCATPWADDGPLSTPAAMRPRLRPDHGGREHESRAESAVGGRGAHAGTARKRPVAATTAEPGLSRAARPTPSVLRRPASGLVREGSSGPTPLFTRHTRGTIEAERDRRRQRRAHGAIAHPGTTRERATSAPLGRIATAGSGNAHAVAQARLDLDRWVDEGGLVPFEAAARLRATTSGR
jgi:hypothetical protein